MGRRIWVGAIVALLLVAAAGGGYVAYTHSEAYQISVARGRGDVWARLDAMGELFNRQDPGGTIPVFVELLSDEDSTIRGKAAEYLGFLGAKEAVTPLIAALAKQGPLGRGPFIEALGTIGDPRAVAPLVALLESADKDEARAVAQALARLGPEVVPALVKRLADPKPALRAAAATGLGRYAVEGDPSTMKETLAPAIAPLIPLLYDPVADVRAAAADAMGNIRDPKFLTSLMLALGDPDERVREIIARVISYYGDAAIALLPSAFQSTDEHVRLGAAEALGAIAEIGSYDPGQAGASYVKAARALLDEALSKRDLVAVAGAYGYYIRRGRPEAVPLLMAALEAHGHRRMANGLLNCGVQELHDAAIAWATAHGYTIETGTGPGEYKWGKQ